MGLKERKEKIRELQSELTKLRRYHQGRDYTLIAQKQKELNDLLDDTHANYAQLIKEKDLGEEE